MLEARIAALEEKLRSATVIDASELATDVVRVGSVVHVKDEKTGKSVEVHDRRLGRGRTRPRTSSPTSRRSARRCSATSATTIVSVQCSRGHARKLKITKIDVGVK